MHTRDYPPEVVVVEVDLASRNPELAYACGGTAKA